MVTDCLWTKKGRPSNDNLEWLRDDCHHLYMNEIEQHAQRVKKRASMIRFSANHAWALKNRFLQAQFLEFGVHEGKDICRLAAFIAEKERRATNLIQGVNFTVIHGFDSFQGLPEAWDNGQNDDKGKTLFGAGTFDTNGKVPEMEALQNSLSLARYASRPGNVATNNVAFHVGLFENVLKIFLEEHKDPIAFIHADADLYSSTLTFLQEICSRKLLVKGSVIVFDEFWNYENWQDGEYKAWCEIVANFDLQFDYLCYHGPSGAVKSNQFGFQAVSVVITCDPK
jgi:hypothetical protein